MPKHKQRCSMTEAWGNIEGRGGNMTGLFYHDALLWCISCRKIKKMMKEISGPIKERPSLRVDSFIFNACIFICGLINVLFLVFSESKNFQCETTQEEDVFYLVFSIFTRLISDQWDTSDAGDISDALCCSKLFLCLCCGHLDQTAHFYLCTDAHKSSSIFFLSCFPFLCFFNSHKHWIRQEDLCHRVSEQPQISQPQNWGSFCWKWIYNLKLFMDSRKRFLHSMWMK